jgi:hypothetical protein
MRNKDIYTTTLLYWLHVDSKYIKWSVKISTFVATIYLQELLIKKGLVVSLTIAENDGKYKIPPRKKKEQ